MYTCLLVLGLRGSLFEVHRRLAARGADSIMVRPSGHAPAGD